MTGLQPPTFPQPDPLPLPGPGWLFWTLLTLTFVTHLVAMNVMLGGSLIAAVARLRRPARLEQGPRLTAMSAMIAQYMPAAVALTVTLGVAPLLFVQLLYGRLLFTSSILMAWIWLSVVALVIAAYYLAYVQAFRVRAGVAPGSAVGWIMALLLAAVAFIYVNNMSLTWRPDRFATMYGESAAGLHLNLADATFVPRLLHMVLGAVAVGGAAVAVMGLFVRHRDEALALTMARHGARWFTWPTAVNLLAGLWWLNALPRETLAGFMSASLGPPLLLLLGVITGVGALAVMALAIRADRPWRLVRLGAWHVVATMALMVVTRDQLRNLALSAAGFQARTWIVPQWGAIALFTLLLVLSLVSIVWMTSALARGTAAGHPSGRI